MPSPLGAAAGIAGGAGAVTSTSTAKSMVAPAGAAGGFGEQLSELISGVEQTSSAANDAVGAMLDKTGEVHDAMIALQRAEMSLQMTVAVRNKLVQAYNDIMRMPV